MGYGECWAQQRMVFDHMLGRKRGEQGGSSSDECQLKVGDAGVLYLVEHNPVYTLGKSGKSENMLISEAYLRSIGAEFYHIDRGGDLSTELWLKSIIRPEFKSNDYTYWINK